MTKQRVYIAAGVTALVGTVVFNSVYLPYYSSISLKEEDANNLRLRKQQIAQHHGGSRGSTWSNIDKARRSEPSSNNQIDKENSK